MPRITCEICGKGRLAATKTRKHCYDCARTLQAKKTRAAATHKRVDAALILATDQQLFDEISRRRIKITFNFQK